MLFRSVLIILWLLMSYNGLVGLRQRCKQAFGDIDVQLKQRHDLIPNLVETVKGYASHERETLDAVVKARTAAISAQGTPGQAQAEGALSAALGRLIAISEAYPDLKANANFTQLQGQLADIEDKIAAARRFFNNAAAEYNASREAIPGAFYAGSMGFQPQEFFNLDEAERKPASTPPQVKF